MDATNSKIVELRAAVQHAQAALDACLNAEYPPGTRVAVTLHSRQKTPTWGTVEGVMDGVLQIQLDNSQSKRRAYRWVASESVRQVVRAGHRSQSPGTAMPMETA
jgi:hypothetical protein